MLQKNWMIQKLFLMAVCISLSVLPASYKKSPKIQLQEFVSERTECASSNMLNSKNQLRKFGVLLRNVNFSDIVLSTEMENLSPSSKELQKKDISFVNETVDPYLLTSEELSLEMECDSMELVAVIVQAEAGNQSLKGMRLVADVILNRMDSPKFPDTAEEVIYAVGQFGPVSDGGLERAAWNMSEDAYRAVEMEWDRSTRLNTGILYFNTSWDNGTNPFKVGDHWFSY